MTTDDYSDWIIFNKPLPELDKVIIPMPKRIKVRDLDKELELEQAIQRLIEQTVYIADLASEIAKGKK